MNKEVAMTELDKERKADQRSKKYLWFGYGNYGGQPNIQTPAGNIRDTGFFEELSKKTKTERSPVKVFMYATMAVIGVMVFVMLLAWGLSLIVG
jgi:hypothetical protein